MSSALSSEFATKMALDQKQQQPSKNIVEGVVRGTGSIVGGVLGGAAIMVSAPVLGATVGAKEGGILGGVGGLVAGAVGGVLMGGGMIIGTTLSGVGSIGVGFFNTPSAIAARAQGKVWDEEKKEWIIYNLKTETDEVLNVSEEAYVKAIVDDFYKTNSLAAKPAAGTTAAGGSSTETKSEVETTVADKEYYEILSVKTNATSAEIKKAYYIKARENHPDRHPNDSAAQAKFQKIGEAYQVLSDDQLRANYDKGGKDGVENAPKMDSSALFAMLFGSEKFDAYLGELQLASQMQAQHKQQEADPMKAMLDITNHPKILGFRQKKREVKCAVKLVEMLQSYVDSKGANAETFKVAMKLEAEELAGTPFGATLVTAIGTSYSEFAQQVQSSFDNLSIGMAQTGRNIGTKYTIASASISAAVAAQKAEALRKKGLAGGRAALTESVAVQVNKHMEDAQMQVFQLMWSVTELDIRSTLVHVCTRVTQDHSVDKETLALRVQGIKLIGEAFLESGGSAAAGLEDIKHRMGAGAGAHPTDDSTEKPAATAANDASNKTETSTGSTPTPVATAPHVVHGTAHTVPVATAVPTPATKPAPFTSTDSASGLD